MQTDLSSPCKYLAQGRIESEKKNVLYTMTSTTCLPSAQSPDQSLVAVVPPSSSPSSTSRILVQVYQVTSSSSQLQLTLTHTPTSPLQELLFCGNSAVVARFGTSQIILWDLDRGVVGQTIESRDEEQFLGLATTSTTTSTNKEFFFYALTKYGTKLVVQEYNRSTGKLVRKIKSGRWEGSEENGASAGNLCVSSTHVVVQTGPGILRVMNIQTGKKIGKIKAAGAVAVTIMKLLPLNETLITAQSGGSMVLYNTSTCEEVSRIPHPVTSSSALFDAVIQFLNDHLLIENTIFSKDGKNDGSFEKLTTLQSKHPMAPFLTQDGRIMVMIHQKQTGCQSHFMELTDNVPETMDLDKLQKETKASESSSSTTTTEKIPKRKSTEPMVLGPGQAGIEAAPPTKKSKVVDEGAEHDEADEDKELSTKDITIAERLQQLTNALDDEDDDDDNMGEEGDGAIVSSKPSFKPHRATTESLKELLSQALQASDDSLLELALAVSDAKVIATTLKDIGSAPIVTLVSKLTTRLASSPLRAEGLSLWLSQCLRHGKFQPHHLAPLRNLLYERTESFSDLLRLEGRLSLMCDVD